MIPKVDRFFINATKWQNEYAELRTIVLECGLTEDLKWGVPCYSFQNSNVVLIHGFKEYCALLLIKGALVNDAKGILVQQTENVQAARQIRFTNVKQIVKQKTTVKAYIKEAIKIEKAGLKVEFKKAIEFNMPKEFENVLEDMPELKKAFYALTPGRQRGYLLYFSQPKQTKTREARIEKYLDTILQGKGLND
jgi:uncharacterized protein YdeI (YjbR/CyaY-like superfamily)